MDPRLSRSPFVVEDELVLLILASAGITGRNNPTGLCSTGEHIECPVHPKQAP